jgi:hypothetical protein
MGRPGLEPAGQPTALTPSYPDRMSAGTIAAVAAVIALPLAVVQWLSVRAQARSEEVNLLREMRSDWLNLKPQWHMAVLTAIGPDDYYSPADQQTRQRFRTLIADIQNQPEVDMDAEASGHGEWSRWHQNTRDRSHEFEQAERDVLFFLGTLASVVFRGRLSPNLAYTVVGLDIARRSRQIRVLLGQERARWTIDIDPTSTEQGMLEREVAGDTGEGPDCPWTYWVDSLPGLTDRILALLDALWAEAARQHDLQTHDLVAAAMLKRESRSGLRNRLRIRRVARQHGSRLSAWRLERGLLAAEYLPMGPPVQSTPFIDLEIVPSPVQGWGFRAWLRRNRAFLGGRLRRCRRTARLELPVSPQHVTNTQGEPGL